MSAEQISVIQWKLDIMRSLGPGNVVIPDILLYQSSINNIKQRKLFHWDQEKTVVIPIFCYISSLYIEFPL